MTDSPLFWCDSHCHFDFPVFQSQRDQHWQWLQQLGLRALVIPAVARQQGEQLSQLCAGKPWFYAQGLHPYFMPEHQPSDLDWLERQMQQDAAIVALGEIGLDKVVAQQQHNLPQQWSFFSAQVALAQQYKKPLILHIRALHDEACHYLRGQNFTYGGVVHAFSGSMQQAKSWLDLGFKLGVGGAFTHNRAIKLRRTLSALPLEALLLETDSPDMLSAFWRGPTHSPAAIPLIAAALATLQGCDLATLAAQQQQQITRLWPALSAAFVGH